MKKKYKIALLFISFIFIFLILFFFLYLNSLKSFRVAHAGGQYNSLNYANSISAINFNSKYTKYIELDMQLTKDNRLVCIHDPIISKKNFSEIKKDFPDKDFCYDVSLKKFLEKNPEIIIIQILKLTI